MENGELSAKLRLLFLSTVLQKLHKNNESNSHEKSKQTYAAMVSLP
jgi:hypothetical protein